MGVTREEIIVVAESLSYVQLIVTPWTVAHQAPESMGFPRQEYWRGLLFPSPRDIFLTCVSYVSCTAGGFFTTEPRGNPGREDTLFLFPIMPTLTICTN